MAEIQSYLRSASHEVDCWPWRHRHLYGTFAAVVLTHAVVIFAAYRLLTPRLEDYRDLDAVREIATDPAVTWLDTTVVDPDAPAPTAALHLPFATGDAPENDPPSRIALPLPPAPVPEATPEPAPVETAPEPPPPPKKPTPAPTKPPVTKPVEKPKAPSMPQLSAAPAPVPKLTPKPVPAPKPVPVKVPAPKAAPRLALAPTPKPAPKPTPTPTPKATPAPPKPPIRAPAPAPAPAVKPALKPVVRLKPEVVAPPAPATTGGAARPGAEALPGRPSAPARPGDLSSYHSLIHDTFHRNWRQPKSLPSGAATYQTKVKIVIARDGSIVDTAIVRASGNPTMDESVQRAVQTVRRIAPLPQYIESANYSVIINFQLD